ncbi:MAG: hypothetical protein JST76_03660 [Bacteroidetes bacterium]|nr:hypothetical protein [Bacteroidota bacterium]
MVVIVALTGCSKETATISDADFYKYICKSIVDSYIAIYNQNIAGNPAGAVDETVSGPLGGTVHITGNTYSSGTLTTIDLIYNLTGAENQYQSGDWKVNITLTGDVSSNGSFSSSYVSENYQSSNLIVHGTVTYKNTTRNVDMSDNVNISRTTNAINALIFGHSVSY